MIEGKRGGIGLGLAEPMVSSGSNSLPFLPFIFSTAILKGFVCAAPSLYVVLNLILMS